MTGFIRRYPSADPERRGRRALVERDAEIVPRDIHLQYTVIEITSLAERRQNGSVICGHLLRAHRCAGQHNRRDQLYVPQPDNDRSPIFKIDLRNVSTIV